MALLHFEFWISFCRHGEHNTVY